MAISAVKLSIRKPKYSPLEELVFDAERTGDKGVGDAGKFVFKLYRNVNADVLTDPLLITEEGDFDGSEATVSFIVDMRDEDVRKAFIQTIEDGKYKIRSLLGKYYATLELKSDSNINHGGPGVTDIQIVSVSPYEFRTSYLPERLLYQARVARTDLDPIEIETATRNILKNSLRDNELERVLRRAESHILAKLDTDIRVRRVITRPDLDERFKDLYDDHVNLLAVPDGYDEVGRETSYRKTDARYFSNQNLPRVPVIEVERVRAVYLNQVFFEFPKSWIANDRFGNLNLVPVQGTSFIQFANAFRSYGPTAAYGAERLPAYWAVDWTYGMAGLEKDFDEVLRLIAYEAAMEVLTFLGSADKPGIASESRSTGGSSESFSYTQSAVYSLFSADVDYIKKQLPDLISKLRQRIHGPIMVVV